MLLVFAFLGLPYTVYKPMEEETQVNHSSWSGLHYPSGSMAGHSAKFNHV